MSLVIDLIGQLNCHVIGSKTRKSWLVRFIAPVSLLLVKLSVQSIVCLFWCRKLVICKEQVRNSTEPMSTATCSLQMTNQ